MSSQGASEKKEGVATAEGHVKGREGLETATSTRDKGNSEQFEAETTLEILYQSPTFINQKTVSH